MDKDAVYSVAQEAIKEEIGEELECPICKSMMHMARVDCYNDYFRCMGCLSILTRTLIPVAERRARLQRGEPTPEDLERYTKILRERGEEK